MKKTVIVLLALFLTLPAVSFAGSATSRWDLTIGGYVKFDMGYNTQAQGQDVALAARSGNGPYDSATDRYGNFFSYAGETRMNFLTKGPDAWGAKTSAFIEGHFRGVEAGAGSGAFVLRHAFMQLDWPTSRLVIGQTWQKWGLLPTFANQLLDYSEIGPFLKGSRQPLIRFEQNITKNWNWAISAISPTNTLNQAGTGAVDSWTLSQMPFYEGSFGWTTDRCGKIGPWQMLFNLEGFYGQQKNVQQLTVTSGGVAQSISYTSKNVDAWGIAFKGFIPVIPEKKGSKKNALSVSGVLFYTQNPSWYQGSYGVNSYAYTSATPIDPDYHAPVIYGGWGQITYFITDKLFVNGWYGYVRNNLSNYYQSNVAGATTIQNTTEIIANIMYDVNQAMRFGFEYAYFNTRYAAYTNLATSNASIGGTTQKDGSMQMFRIGAYYFF